MYIHIMKNRPGHTEIMKDSCESGATVLYVCMHTIDTVSLIVMVVKVHASCAPSFATTTMSYVDRVPSNSKDRLTVSCPVERFTAKGVSEKASWRRYSMRCPCPGNCIVKTLYYIAITCRTVYKLCSVTECTVYM